MTAGPSRGSIPPRAGRPGACTSATDRSRSPRRPARCGSPTAWTRPSPGSIRPPWRRRPRSRSAAGLPRWPQARARCGSPTSTRAPSRGSTRAVTRPSPAWPSAAPRPRSSTGQGGYGWPLPPTAAAIAAGRSRSRPRPPSPRPPRRPATSIDPAFFDYAFNPQFCGLAYDDLVTFQQSAGADGLRLVPDLAWPSQPRRRRPDLRLPDPSRHPLLRRPAPAGQRLPPRDRAPVPGRTPRAALLRRPGRRGRVRRAPAGCDLSRGIVTDDATGTVTFHLAAPDPEFLFKLTEFAYAAPIPPGTPDHEPGSRTVPGTGPYRIAHASRHRDPVRPQPAVPRVVPRRPAGRQSRHDRVADRADRAGRGDRGQPGAGRLVLRPAPAGSVPAASAPASPPSCTPAPSSPSSSLRSTPTSPRSTTSGSGGPSTTRSTGARSSSCTAGRTSPPPPASRSLPACAATPRTARTRCDPASRRRLERPGHGPRPAAGRGIRNLGGAG